MRRSRIFPLVAGGILLVLCTIPVIALLTLGQFLDRGCRVENTRSGEAGSVMVWRIETVRCGQGPAVTNVLLAPRGKSMVLVASATGTPLPAAVMRSEDGVTSIVLDGATRDGVTSRTLALKATGRPATPLVLADGRPKS